VSRPALIAVPALIALLLAGCSAGAPVPTPTPEPTYAVTGDGVLRIGTLFSLSDPSSTARIAAVEVAVREVNAAGGFAGAPVEVLHRNAGDDPAAVAPIVTALGERGVDVLIGGTTDAMADAIAEAAAALDLAVVIPATGAAADEPLLALLRQSDPATGDTTGAVEAYEAVILSALAAAAADDDGGAAIVRTLPALAEGASSCALYAACLDVIAHDTGIAYSGRSDAGVALAVRAEGGVTVG